MNHPLQRGDMHLRHLGVVAQGDVAELGLGGGDDLPEGLGQGNLFPAGADDLFQGLALGEAGGSDVLTR